MRTTADLIYVYPSGSDDRLSVSLSFILCLISFAFRSSIFLLALPAPVLALAPVKRESGWQQRRQATLVGSSIQFPYVRPIHLFTMEHSSAMAPVIATKWCGAFPPQPRSTKVVMTLDRCAWGTGPDGASNALLPIWGANHLARRPGCVHLAPSVGVRDIGTRHNPLLVGVKTAWRGA